MKNTLIILAFFISTSVIAETKGKEYLGMQFGVSLYTEDGSPDYNPTFGAIRAGYNVNKNFALEGRYGEGNREDTNTVLGVPVSVDINHFRGIYGLVSFSLTRGIEPYILAGYTSARITYSSLGTSLTAKQSGISYGMGFNFMGYGKDLAWNIEYVSYINETDILSSQVSLSSVNIGATLLF
ncbi:MAG: porin family protein [Gammaproteobacteria bacterium]|nr:porin family protein [Gammaproteobacteria bacterium]